MSRADAKQNTVDVHNAFLKGAFETESRYGPKAIGNRRPEVPRESGGPRCRCGQPLVWMQTAEDRRVRGAREGSGREFYFRSEATVCGCRARFSRLTLAETRR